MKGPEVEHVPLSTWLWVCGLSLLFGLAFFTSRFEGGKRVERWWLALAHDILYCEAAGLLAFLACKAADVPDGWQWVFISLGSHMGARFVGLMQYINRRNLAARIGGG